MQMRRNVSVMAVVVAIDVWLLYRFFGRDEAREVTSVR